MRVDLLEISLVKKKTKHKETSNKCDLLYLFFLTNLYEKINKFKRYERACVTKERTIKVKLDAKRNFISVTLTQETDVVYFYPCL